MTKDWGALARLGMLGLAASTPLAAVADEAGKDVEKVVVTGVRDPRPATGTKTDAPVIETPQSVSVVPSERFEAQGAQSLQDVLLYSSGVRADAYGYDSRGDWAFIRGVDFVQYLDGLRMLTGYYNTPRPDPFTLDRVEILRGPASVLYGQSSIGGVVNLVSKAPKSEFGGSIGVEAGSYGRLQVEGDVSGPIDSDGEWLYRLVAVGRESDTHVDFVPDDRTVIAPSLTWRPSEATNLTLRAVFQDDDTGSATAFLPHSGVLLANPNGKIPFSRFVSEPGFDQYDTKLSSVGWSFSHAFSEIAEFRQQVRYTESAVNYQSMYPDSYSNPHDPFIDADDRVLNRYVYVSRPDVTMVGADNQLQLDFATGTHVEHSVLGGVDVHYFNQTGEQGFGLGAPIDVFAPVYAGQTVPALSDIAENTQRQIGAYLQDQITFDERLIVLASIRRDTTKNETDGAGDETDWATTKRFGLLYRSESGLAPYVSYSESFLPVAGTNLFGQPFKPLRGEQWEAGLKFQPEGAPYIVTAAVFDITEQNRLIADPGNPFNQIQAGEVTSRGFEFEGSGKLFENTDMIVGYSYTEVEDDSGRQLESVPKHVASAWVSHTFPIDADVALRAGAGVRYVGESYGYILAPPATTITTPANTLADAMIGADIGSWTVALNASNVFDKAYVATCLGRGDCFVGAPRRVTASVAYRF